MMQSSKRYTTFMIDEILNRDNEFCWTNSPHFSTFGQPLNPTPVVCCEKFEPNLDQQKNLFFSNFNFSINECTTITEPIHRFSLENFILRQLLLKRKVLAQSKTKRGGQIRFNYHQTIELEEEFSRCKYLLPVDRKLLAMKLQLTERQVKTWFQNRRAKWRRIRESTHQQSSVIFKESQDADIHCHKLSIMSNNVSDDSE